MNRNTRLIVVVGIAVVVAALASAGVFVAIKAQKPVVVEKDSVFYVVAKKTLETGVLLTRDEIKDQVKVIGWPKSHPVAGTFANVEDVVERGLVAGVVENEPITESKLAPRNTGGGLPPKIRPGKRAMSVRVNEVIGVAGFVTPGTKVDVFVTLREQEGSSSHLVVSDVEVLTAGTRYDDAEAKKQGKAIPSSVVTLMVLPAEAERIALAASEGQIVLALRNPLDKEKTTTNGTTVADLTGGKRPAPSGPSRPAPQPTTNKSVGTPQVQTRECTVAVEAFKAGKREREVIPCP